MANRKAKRQRFLRFPPVFGGIGLQSRKDWQMGVIYESQRDSAGELKAAPKTFHEPERRPPGTARWMRLFADWPGRRPALHSPGSWFVSRSKKEQGTFQEPETRAPGQKHFVLQPGPLRG